MTTKKRVKHTAKRRARRSTTTSSTAASRPGVIATILAMMARPQGVTRNEAVAKLVKQFPDRAEASMANTCGPRLGSAARKAKVEGRGLVYYGRAGRKVH